MKRSLLRLRVLEAVASTNNEIKHALEDGESEGLVVCARMQTDGYGRQGRSWSSPQGGLYCSWLLRPQVSPEILSTLSLVTALAVRRTLVLLAPDEACNILVKWPNDVVYVSSDNADSGIGKISGISVEVREAGVCVGIGINICVPSEQKNVGGKNVAVYMTDLAPNLLCLSPQNAVDKVLQAFISEFIPLYNMWISNGFTPFVREYNGYASLSGCFVRIVDLLGKEFAQGEVLRVEANGCLILSDTSGAEISIASGEVHLV